MLIRSACSVSESEVTPHEVYLNRRQWMAAGAALGVSGSTWAATLAAQRSPLSTTETMNTRTEVTSYNNFYEFGYDKTDPAAHAHTLKTDGWRVEVMGYVEKPMVFSMADLLKLAPLEERIYRLRCVEGWSMVIPWIGFPLSALLKKVQPTSQGKFLEFSSLADETMMPGVRRGLLDWPYREGLRIDEAMHPLTILAVGLYGNTLPNQNGAPVRLVVPWKYGFKSAKSIVRIELIEKARQTSWMKAGPNEYGYFANVNPDVPHPRWSQASERRIGELLKRKTLPFNGYAEQVAGLYRGLDLKRFF